MPPPKFLKFTPAAADIFERVYEQSVNRQIKIKHPQQPVMDKKQWDTICYNFAIIAASAYEGKELIVDDQRLG
jgi:hypothetical protein